MPNTLRFWVISSLIFSLVSCGETKKPATAPIIPNVNVVSIDITPSYNVTREFIGSVATQQRANLGFELNGKIEQILVDVGDQVQQKDPLLKLDIQLLKTEQQQLKAQRDQLEAQIELVKNNLRRQQQLKEKGFSAAAETDSLISERDRLLATIRQLDASLASNALLQEKSIIYAPYTGKISHRFVSKGDVINAGQPTLTLLSDAKKEAQIGIPAKFLNDLSTAQNLTLRIENQTYPTKILNLGADIDMQTRTVILRLAIPDNAKVLNGQQAYLEYKTTIKQSGFWLPLTGLTDGLRGTWNVYVAIEDEQNNHRLSRRSVQVHYSDENNAYVSGAVSDKENVVKNGIHRIVPNQSINIVAE